MKPRTRQMLKREREEALERARQDEAFQERTDKAIEANADLLERLAAAEEEVGLEYVGPDKGSNRETRRQMARDLKRMTRRPEGCLQVRHPLLDTLTPRGRAVLKRRRKRARIARASRKEAQRAAALRRRKRRD